MYPSMLSRNSDVEIEPYYCLPIGTMAASIANAGGNATVAWSQPTSPTPPASRFSYGPLSPSQTKYRLTYPKKNDEGQYGVTNPDDGYHDDFGINWFLFGSIISAHGSAASLLSGGSSLYNSAEERQANEIRHLKRQLNEAREQVMSLSSQVTNNVSKIYQNSSQWKLDCSHCFHSIGFRFICVLNTQYLKCVCHFRSPSNSYCVPNAVRDRIDEWDGDIECAEAQCTRELLKKTILFLATVMYCDVTASHRWIDR